MNMQNPVMRILLIDDDVDVRRTLGDYLRGRGHEVHIAEDGVQALALLQRELVDIIITDVRMPGIDGFEVLRRVREQWPHIEVIVATAYGDVESAVQALREGAFDYFAKPFKLHDISASLRRTARFQLVRRENERYRERLERLDVEGKKQYGLEAIVGESPAISKVKELVVEVAKTEATTVLIEGETGVGKELVARAIHYESARTSGPFIAVDCSAVPESLVESAFYGHVKGAFTDARDEHKGFFEQAEGGTLFLDEIGDMAPGMQTRLLRTLEERRVRRVGGEREVEVDVRVVSATHRDLDQAVAEGLLRADLYYRLNIFAIRIPPLRERREDIPLLAQHFVARFAGELHKELVGFAPEAERLLAAHDFPGNIRELRNMVERAVIRCREGAIGAEDLDVGGSRSVVTTPVVAEQQVEKRPTSLNLEETEKRMIAEALRRCGGNKVQAGQLLGISRDALRRRMGRYGLEE